jgi:hypothetical protein
MVIANRNGLAQIQQPPDPQRIVIEAHSAFG